VSAQGFSITDGGRASQGEEMPKVPVPSPKRYSAIRARGLARPTGFPFVRLETLDEMVAPSVSPSLPPGRMRWL
jgi:hypothetical protein